MAFDKLIIKSLTGAAKSGIKMDLALDSLKEKMIDNISSRVEDEIPVQLPFDTRAALLGDDLPSDLMSPETINSVQTIPAFQKPQINDTLDTIENTLNVVITQKNTLQGALDNILSPLSSLESISTTLGGIVDGIKTGVTTIKSIPAPTSVPPGVGIPLNIINGFSDALDTLGNLISKFEGSLDIIPGAIQQINDLLIPITEKFALFDPIFDKVIKIISFIRLLLSLPKEDGIQQSDIDNALNSVANNIQQSLAVTSPNSSNPNVNGAANQALLDQLDPNSNNPLFYRGFRLIIEFDPNNTFSFPARRIKAYSDTEGVTLYSVPPDQGSGEINTSSTYSFSISVEVLISEVKFNIDNYFISKSRVNVSPTIIDKVK